MKAEGMQGTCCLHLKSLAGTVPVVWGVLCAGVGWGGGGGMEAFSRILSFKHSLLMQCAAQLEQQGMWDAGGGNV